MRTQTIKVPHMVKAGWKDRMCVRERNGKILKRTSSGWSERFVFVMVLCLEGGWKKGHKLKTRIRETFEHRLLDLCSQFINSPVAAPGLHRCEWCCMKDENKSTERSQQLVRFKIVNTKEWLTKTAGKWKYHLWLPAKVRQMQLIKTHASKILHFAEGSN